MCRGCNTPLNQRFCNTCGLDSQCAQCGATLTASFCGECGAPATTTAASVPAASEPKQDRKAKFAVLAIVVTLIVLIGGVAVAINAGSGSKSATGSATPSSTIATCSTSDFSAAILKGWDGSSGAEQFLTADISRVKTVRDGSWALVPVSDKTSGRGYQSGTLLMHCDQDAWVLAEPIFSTGRGCALISADVQAVLVEVGMPCADRSQSTVAPPTAAPTTTSAAAANYKATYDWMVRTADEKNMGQYCFAWQSGGGQGLVAAAESNYIRVFGSSKTFDSSAVYAYYNGRC